MRKTVVAAAMLLTTIARAEDFKTIGTADLAAKLASPKSTWSFTLIDARSRVEFDEMHIPGAVLLPARQVTEKLPSLVKGKGHELIFYCNGPTCTKTVTSAKAAAALGYTNVLEYKEGLPAWAKAGHKTEGQPLPPFEAPVISAADLKAALAGAKPPFVIDIRDAAEYSGFHIAKTVNVPLDEITGYGKKFPAGRGLVIVDHAGHQVHVAGRVLKSLGRSDVRRLDGGILKWQAQGLPVVNGK